MANAYDLISLFKNATGNTLQTDIEVTADLDFSSSNLRRPLGAFSNGTCVSFSGVFQGNGHSIKSLKMNNQNNEGYKHAGLFCSLMNAIVENIIIDSSCSFTGYSAGALSVSVNGSLTVKHTTNNATVSGTENVGGFVGYVQDLKQPTVTSFEDCVNNGIITASGYGVGGFVGNIIENTNMTITISNSINCGNATGRSFVGGFVGRIWFISGSYSITLEIMNSVNKGSVSSTEGMAGGFVCVDPYGNFNVKTTIKNSINKGSVNAATDAYGITNIITVARNVVSMGDVTGSSGSFTFWNPSTDVHLFFGLDGKCTKCGGAILFKHNTNTGFYEVVGTGEHVDDLLNDESVNQHFGMVWSTELELVDKVTLTVNVSGLLNGTLLVESGTPLNELAEFGEFWQDKYGLVSGKKERIEYEPAHLVSRNMSIIIVQKHHVSVGGPYNTEVYVLPNTTIKQLMQDHQLHLDGFIIVDNHTNDVLNELSMIERDTVLKLCHNVSVLNASDSCGFLVEHQQPLQTNTDLVDWTKGYHLAQSNQNNKTELLLSHIVEHDLDLVLCSLVTTTGVINTTFLVESGKKLGEISGFSTFFNSSFIIYDNRDKDIALTSETSVTSDVTVVITKVIKQEIVIKFDENENITVEEVKNAIKDLVELPDDEHVWIEVISQDDGSFVISIKQTGEEQTDVADSLKDCSLSKNNT